MGILMKKLLKSRFANYQENLEPRPTLMENEPMIPFGISVKKFQYKYCFGRRRPPHPPTDPTHLARPHPRGDFRSSLMRIFSCVTFCYCPRSLSWGVRPQQAGRRIGREKNDGCTELAASYNEAKNKKAEIETSAAEKHRAMLKRRLGWPSLLVKDGRVFGCDCGLEKNERTETRNGRAKLRGRRRNPPAIIRFKFPVAGWHIRHALDARFICFK